MAKLDLDLNKTYIVKENDEIFTLKLYDYSKNELFVKVEEADSGKLRWRYVSDFDTSIEILDEHEDVVEIKNQPIEQPIIQPVPQLQESNVAVAVPVIPAITPYTADVLPYTSNYNLNKIQNLVTNIEAIINQYKQGK